MKKSSMLLALLLTSSSASALESQYVRGAHSGVDFPDANYWARQQALTKCSNKLQGYPGVPTIVQIKGPTTNNGGYGAYNGPCEPCFVKVRLWCYIPDRYQ